jgi:two-component system response regulator
VTHASHSIGGLEFIFGTGAFAKRDLRDLPALILLDLEHEKEGLPFIRILRGYLRTMSIPIVVLDGQKPVEAFTEGAQGLIEKPFTFEKFVQALRNIGLAGLL